MSDSNSLWATTSVLHYFCLDISSINVELYFRSSQIIFIIYTVTPSTFFASQ